MGGGRRAGAGADVRPAGGRGDRAVRRPLPAVRGSPHRRRHRQAAGTDRAVTGVGPHPHGQDRGGQVGEDGREEGSEDGKQNGFFSHGDSKISHKKIKYRYMSTKSFSFLDITRPCGLV